MKKQAVLTIQLFRRGVLIDKYLYVDKQDFNRLSQYAWSLFEIRGKEYARRCIRLGTGRKAPIKTIYAHRFILNLNDPFHEVDHINGNGLDNTRKNLRICTHHQNLMNKSKNMGNTSKFKGVTKPFGRTKWTAQITLNRKNHFLGTFNKEIEAAQAYNKAAELYFREFAKLNQI